MRLLPCRRCGGPPVSWHVRAHPFRTFGTSQFLSALPRAPVLPSGAFATVCSRRRSRASREIQQLAVAARDIRYAVGKAGGGITP